MANKSSVSSLATSSLATSSSATSSFASWTEFVSSHTNRSLAGHPLPAQTFENPADIAAAQTWGLIVTAQQSNDESQQSDQNELLHPDYDVRELSGLQAMDYAQAHMPVTAHLLHQLSKQGLNLHDTSIAVSMVLEPKTAVLLRLLKQAGARVGVFCEPSATDNRVAEQLKHEGIVVEADARRNGQQAHEGALRLLDTLSPTLIIDDGASFARLAALERPHLLETLRGVAEETTSGVRAFEAMQRDGNLTFPVVAVNDSELKTGFDNTHGTGETCVTALQTVLGSNCFESTNVAVIGYGPVGRGFALRARALGAHVIVCDIDPVACLRAVFEGFETRNIDEVLSSTDMVVSATGVRHTVTLEHMQQMRDNAIVTVIGGIANEIALDELDYTPTGEDVTLVQVPNGPTLRLIADGDGVNYTAAGGNPIEIMDLSFAVQVSALHALLTRDLTPGLHRLGKEADRAIASVALETRGFSLSQATADNGYSWRLTRFEEDKRLASK